MRAWTNSLCFQQSLCSQDPNQKGWAPPICPLGAEVETVGNSINGWPQHFPLAAPLARAQACRIKAVMM